MEHPALLDDHGATPLQILTFTLGTTTGRQARFGVDIAQVREVAQAPHITPIPGAAPHVAGMVSLREELMRVVDLASALLGQPTAETTGFLIVTDRAGRQQSFLVAGIESILRIRQRDIRQLDRFDEPRSGLIAGIVKTDREQLVTLLDLDQLQLAADPLTSEAELAALAERLV